MKVGFVSLGCSKNLVDTEIVIGHFKKHNFEIVATSLQTKNSIYDIEGDIIAEQICHIQENCYVVTPQQLQSVK